MDTMDAGVGGRMLLQHKQDAVLYLLRSKGPGMVSRSLGVIAATLSAWQDAFLDGGEASLATKPAGTEERESAASGRGSPRCCSRQSFSSRRSRCWRAVAAL